MKNNLKTMLYAVLTLISLSTSTYLYVDNKRLKQQLEVNRAELSHIKTVAEQQIQQATIHAAAMDEQLKFAQEQLDKKNDPSQVGQK